MKKTQSKKSRPMAKATSEKAPMRLAVGGSRKIHDDDLKKLSVANRKVAELREALGQLTIQSLQLDAAMRKTADEVTTAHSDVIALSKAAIASLGEDPESNVWNVDFSTGTVTRTKLPEPEAR